MKIGIGTHTYPWAFASENSKHAMTIDHLLALAADFGCCSVQIADNYPLHQIPSESIHGLKKKAQKHGLQLEVGARGMIKEKVLQYLEIAKVIDASFLRVVIDLHEYQPSMQEVIHVVKDLIPFFEAAGIVLAIENHDRFPSSELEKIVKSTSEEWVGICLDTANSIGAGEGINEVLRYLAKYTVNLHIKDLSFKRLSHNMGFEIHGCPAGQGDLDLPHIIDAVNKHGKLKSILLETWSDWMGNEQETIQRERKWAKNSVAYMQSLV